MNTIRQYDTVALLEKVSATHFETQAPLILCPGQMGAVLDIYADGACEVEFCDMQGCTYAMLPLQPAQLMVLHTAPVDIAA